MTLLPRLYMKLDSQALKLCVQIPVLVFVHGGHTARIPWSQHCVRVCLTNFCIVRFLVLLSLVLYM